jgi:predicted RNase H-like HicB family nuclease
MLSKGGRLTAVFEKCTGGYIAYVEEIPGVNTQGKTIEEARENLSDALLEVLIANRELTEKERAGKSLCHGKIIKEEMAIPT